MNKIIKGNIYFLLLFLLLLHCLGINIFLFKECWEEKEYWEDLQTHWTKETYWNLKDFEKYVVITTDDLLINVYQDWEGLLHLSFATMLLIFYIIFPSMLVLVNKKINLKKTLFFDILVFICSLFLFITIFLDILKTGIIPLYIFIPIMLLILIFFRIYQYKKKLIFE